MDEHGIFTCNDIFPGVFAVLASMHFDINHDFLEVTIQFDVARMDDVIGEE